MYFRAIDPHRRMPRLLDSAALVLTCLFALISRFCGGMVS
jgi:hypothetical protein